jgi:hypothetical protein
VEERSCARIEFCEKTARLSDLWNRLSRVLPAQKTLGPRRTQSACQRDEWSPTANLNDPVLVEDSYYNLPLPPRKRVKKTASFVPCTFDLPLDLPLDVALGTQDQLAQLDVRSMQLLQTLANRGKVILVTKLWPGMGGVDGGHVHAVDGGLPRAAPGN